MIEAILGALAVAAAEPQKAEPKNDPARWVRASDLPRISGDVAVTTFDLTIDKAGKPVGCAIIVSSGQDDLDNSVCNAVMKRARFRPASEANGSTIYSVRRDRVIWKPQERGDNTVNDDPDLVITTPDLQTHAGVLVEVLLEVGTEGDTKKCTAVQSSRDNRLDALACEVAINPQIALPIINEAGQRVAGLRTLFVAFEPGSTMSVKIR
jgi:hypothetical protein